jgi:hypothetical protein
MNWYHVAQDRFQWWVGCEQGNESSRSIEGGVFLDQMGNY